MCQLFKALPTKQLGDVTSKVTSKCIINSRFDDFTRKSSFELTLNTIINADESNTYDDGETLFGDFNIYLFEKEMKAC